MQSTLQSTPNLPKGLLLAKYWTKNKVFVERLKGEIQKSIFFSPIGSHLGTVLHLPKTDPGYVLGPSHEVFTISVLTESEFVLVDILITLPGTR